MLSRGHFCKFTYFQFYEYIKKSLSSADGPPTPMSTRRRLKKDIMKMKEDSDDSDDDSDSESSDDDSSEDENTPVKNLSKCKK